ncbi:hypothetical protein GCM10010339_69900 [Streptomyces alanosinicus]|uniref:HTH merR-type domain-containing protein n=1 Tax=Streptomyces alanosinicus TaxID=68171 RepID=A0A919D6M5_9ACTN|nr:MerR family transcriptional regulator [Streptomyces alanosinicus]GHE11193.1 hypothetical protein GCM10010339_69900 [Streptomyces alanosinicus]
MTEDGTGLLTIGALARATGLTVRTIRYWSDEDVLTPVARSTGGYRLYDTAAVARLELIRTLRELGLGLDEVRKVLAGERTVAEVAAPHVAALDAQISALKVTRAVLSTVARRGSDAEEVTLLNKLARLPAAQRQRIVDRVGVQLPDDPPPEQADVWAELAELLRNPDSRALLRRMIEFDAADRTPDTPARASAGVLRTAGRAGRRRPGPRSDPALTRGGHRADRTARHGHRPPGRTAPSASVTRPPATVSRRPWH